MRRAMGCTDDAKSILEERENFLDPVAQDQAGTRKLAGQMPYVFARIREQIHPALREFLRLGLREIAAITYDNPVSHPAREGSEEFAIVYRSGGQIKATPPPRLITLHMELE